VMSKIKIIASTALALLVLGMVLSATAWAAAPENPMPFWHHRASAAEGEGKPIAENEPENLKASAKEAKLKGKVLGIGVTVQCELEFKAEIYNIKRQGQGKSQATFGNCFEGKKSPEECKVKVEQVRTSFHLLWKWNGTKAQLVGQGRQRKYGQRIDGFVIVHELEEVPQTKGAFTTLTFENGTGTCLAPGKFEVQGDTSFDFITPGEMEEWSKAFTIAFAPPGPLRQHFQYRLPNGTIIHVGIQVGLIFANEPAVFTAEPKGEFEKQEVSTFEEEP
jgi:hypothetical protein